MDQQGELPSCARAVDDSIDLMFWHRHHAMGGEAIRGRVQRTEASNSQDVPVQDGPFLDQLTLC
jgi:hypothetical protein